MLNGPDPEGLPERFIPNSKDPGYKVGDFFETFGTIVDIRSTSKGIWVKYASVDRAWQYL
jgi:hypothetical protein